MKAPMVKKLSLARAYYEAISTKNVENTRRAGSHGACE